MHGYLQHLVALQRIADRVRAAERAQLANEARAQRRDPHDAQPIVTVRARLFCLAARLTS
jgi:hypothetical protein